MDLETLLKRPEIFRQFLINSKKNCYSKLTENEFPEKFSSDFRNNELYSTYEIRWRRLKPLVQQEIFLGDERIWSMDVDGEVDPVVDSDLQRIKGAIVQAMLADGKNIIPARGPLVMRGSDYLYTASTTEINSKYDGIFNFNISEKLRRKSDREVVYTAEARGKLLCIK